eukprot:m51a1_g8205 hypothetical protein (225) ;mRNA; r:48980-50028
MSSSRKKTAALVSEDDVRRRADEVCHNSPDVEAAWAVKAFEFAEQHMQWLASVPRNADPRNIRMTGNDDEIIKAFEVMFPGFGVASIKEDDLKSPEAKNKWRPFCMHFEKTVEDYNYGTMLRLDATKDYSEDNCTFAPRVQFLAIEIARLRAGLNKSVMGPEEAGAEGNVYNMRRCAVCGKEAPFRCTRCKETRYCSRECQRQAWPSHKAECRKPAQDPPMFRS